MAVGIHDIGSVAKAQAHGRLDPQRTAQRAVRGRDAAGRRRIAAAEPVDDALGAEVDLVARPACVHEHDIARVDVHEAGLCVQGEGSRGVVGRLREGQVVVSITVMCVVYCRVFAVGSGQERIPGSSGRRGRAHPGGLQVEGVGNHTWAGGLYTGRG